MMWLQIGSLLSNTFSFLFVVIGIFGLLGLFSRSFLVAVYSAFMGYIVLTLESQYNMFITVLFILIPAILIIMSFQVYNLTQNNAGEMG